MPKLPSWDDADALWLLWIESTEGPVKQAQKYFPDRQWGYVHDMHSLVGAAVNRATMLRCAARADNTAAEVYRLCANQGFDSLGAPGKELAEQSGWGRVDGPL